ncbi:MAG: hypothetical protein NUW22_12365 [Acidobacteria bacterium]|nr:hypothetical protein [Acidobacteriota bacterium]
MTVVAFERSQGERRREALKYLAVARQAEVDPAVGVVYQRGLEDIDAGLVERACEAFGKEPRADYKSALPELGALRARCEGLAREDAERAAATKLLPMPASEDDPRTWYFCQDCHDESSGWREYFCAGSGALKDPARRPYALTVPVYPCARKQGHAPHAYVEKCPCYATNPVIAKRREAQQQHTTQRAK